MRRQPAATSLTIKQQQDVLTVDTGPLRAVFDPKRSGFPTGVWFDANGDRNFSADEEWTGARAITAEITGERQARFAATGPAEQIEIEESGPVRTVIKTAGHFAGATPQLKFAYVNRFVSYAGAPFVRVYHTWRNESEASGLTAFRSIGLQFPSPSGSDTVRTLGLGAKETSGTSDVAVYQMRDNAFSLESPEQTGIRTQPGRADGWLDASNGRWGVTLAVRDFWQLYPKALRATADGLFVDLCPPFADGTYDQCSKLDEIKLYYYLMGGCYRVARGVQKQHELLLAFHPGKLSPQTRQLEQAFQEPLIAVCAPDRYCDTRVFGEILPATTGRTPEYEKVCQQVYQNYVRHRESNHEYGMLNFGDQWGERRVNWANGEYDHHHAMLMQFIRGGERRWYFLADRAARHAIDVDTCHDGPRKGIEWIHSMGHTGGYFRTQYEGDGIPGPGSSVSHTWTEGFCDWYALSGDPTAAENAALVADYHGGAYLNNYDWGNCRTNGWHLLLTMATYRLSGDPFYLNAARIIVARTLQRQGPDGGWQRQMVPGHCLDMPRHRGEANFMLGVLANGLEEYYREVPDPAVARAIVGGARQAVRELWVPESNGFRYTSCPNMKGYTANNDMTSEILLFAHRLGGDAEFARIGQRAMEAAFRGGIGSMAHLRWTPHIIYNLDLLKRE